MSTKVSSEKLIALTEAVKAKFPGQLVTAVQTEDDEVVVSVFKGGKPVKLFVPTVSLLVDDPGFPVHVAESFADSVYANPIPQWGEKESIPDVSKHFAPVPVPGTYGAIEKSTEPPPWKPVLSKKIPAKMVPQPKTMYDLYGVNDVDNPKS